MSTDRSAEGLSLGDDEVTVESPGPARELAQQLARRWKHGAVAAITAVTTWFLYGINETWTKDAMAFALITAIIVGYSLATLYLDLEFT